ncbi:hypothetical protein ACODH8_02285 [Vagococcus fluvialis]|uniref:hypothetical protein n=1 Tax=Vagococcus fluvialis TaxID=2738 RepID=UPI003B5CBAB0
MAERRMFAKTIIDSDLFLDMPLTTQLLYFHLSMRADDDGFINNPKRILRTVGCGDDDLKILITKNFIIPFESGIVVIKHWKIHNYIRVDRYKATVYSEEKQQLITNENKIYDVGMSSGIPNDNQMETQVRLGKDRLGKDNNNIDQMSQKNDDKENVKNSFESIWKLYPKKQGKDNSFKAYQKALKDGVTDEQIIQGIEDYKKQIEIQRTEMQYVKNGSTFFNQRCYLDEFITMTNKRQYQASKAEEVPPEWAEEYAGAGQFTVSDDDLLDLPF